MTPRPWLHDHGTDSLDRGRRLIGIVVMVIAVLPHLRVGGMRLFRAEASDKSEKFTARSSNVARSIGTVYVGLSLACALSYWLAGMNAFNEVYHAMTTVSTGGFSTSDQSLRQFADPDVAWVSSIFIFLSGLPFVLMVQFVRGPGFFVPSFADLRQKAVFAGRGDLTQRVPRIGTSFRGQFL